MQRMLQLLNLPRPLLTVRRGSTSPSVSPSPQGREKTKNRRNHDFSWVLARRDDAFSFFIRLRRGFILNSIPLLGNFPKPFLCSECCNGSTSPVRVCQNRHILYFRFLFLSKSLEWDPKRMRRITFCSGSFQMRRKSSSI